MIELHNVDCMEYMKTCENNKFDLAIVDPPYNIVSQQKRGVGSRIDVSGKMNNWNNKSPTDEYFKELFRISKDQIIWGANNYEGLPKTEYFCIWNKEQTVDNFASLEYAWLSNGVGKPAKMFTYSIHRHNSTKGVKIHPTMKPVQLYEWLLLKYAKPGQTIFDSHFGSLSIGIACHNLGFDLTACELDKDYFDAAKKRLEIHQMQKRWC